MSTERTNTQNWPDLAIGLYDRLTGRDAEITYDFDNLNIQVPSRTGSDAEQAHWNLQGRIRISTRSQSEGSA